MPRRSGNQNRICALQIDVRYRSDIDGLRAVAVTFVVLFHAGGNFVGGGFVGVDIFFVISGFLICRLLIDELERGRFSLANFYARRARRILPALTTVVVAVSVLGALVLSGGELRGVSISALTALLGISNIRFWQSADYFAPDAHGDPLLMTWSLGIEEQFYLAFPCILYIFGRNHASRVRLIALLVLVSFAASIVVTRSDTTSAFYLMPTRAWELAVGAFLSVIRLDGPWLKRSLAANTLSATGIACVAMSAYYFTPVMPFPGYAAALPVAGAAALIAAESSWINRYVLSSRILVFGGGISYSWYLWHWPLFVFFKLLRGSEPSTLETQVLAVLSVVLAFLSWRFIERPFRVSAAPPARTLIAYTCVIASASCVLFAAIATGGFPQRLPKEVQALELGVAHARRDPCLARWRQSKPNVAVDCVPAGAQDRAIALIGDSHGAALAGALRMLADQAGWATHVYTKASCRPLVTVTVWRRDQPSLAADCAHFMRDAVSRIQHDPSVRVVLLAGFWHGALEDPNIEKYIKEGCEFSEMSGRELLRTGLTHLVQALAFSGKSVVVAEDVPYLELDPTKKAFARLIPVRRSIARVLGWSPENADSPARVIRQNAETDAIIHEVTKRESVPLLPLRSALCSESGCHDVRLGVPLYLDRSHLSVEGALLVLRPLTSLLFRP